MATNTRKVRGAPKAEKARFRFFNAADAKAVEERLSRKSSVDYVRTGRVIAIDATKSRILENAASAEDVEVFVIGPRGRPAKDEAAPKAKKAPAAAKKTTKKTSKKKGSLASMTEIADEIKKAAKTKKRGPVMKKGDPKEVLGGIPDEHRHVSKKRRLKAKQLVKPSSRKSKVAKAGSTRPVWILNITSTNLTKAWFNVQNETLTVEFKSGKRYRYSDVSIEEFAEFTLAESQGKWFIENIKDSKDYKELRG